MPTNFVKGSQEKYNAGIIRESASGRFVAELNRDGKRRRKQCASKAIARKWIDQETTRRNDQGKVAFQLPEREMREAANAMDLLKRKGYQIRLSEAVNFYIKHNPLNQDGITLQALLDAYIHQLENPMDGGDRASEETTRTKKKRLSSFMALHGDRDIRSLTKTDVDAWVHSFKNLKPRTILNYRAELQSLLNFAEVKTPGFINDLCKVTQRKKRGSAPVEIMTPEVTEAILRQFEAKKSKRYAAAFAIMCFAGVRPEELLRSTTENSHKTPLTWQGVNFETRMITIRAHESKIGAWREVPITDNLYAWLQKYRGAGRIAPSRSTYNQARRDAIAKVHGIEKWVQDYPRHSFATYAGAIHGLHHVAGWMGHVGGISVLNAHYKGRTTRETAEAYFNIMPS